MTAVKMVAIKIRFVPVDYRHQNDAYADVMGYLHLKSFTNILPLVYLFWSNVLSHLHEDKKFLNRVKRTRTGQRR